MPRPTVHRFWHCAELPFVEARLANDSRACYAPHAHATLSIGAVDGGSSVLERCGERQRLGRGDIVVIPAGQVHCCNPQEDGQWSYQMLYLDANWLSGIADELSEFGAFSELGGRALRPAPDATPPPSRAPGLHARLTHLNTLLFSDAAAAAKEAALLLFAGDLFAASAAQAAAELPTRPVNAALRRVQELIGERCGETLRLDELAACAGMSRYRLLRAFRDAYGMTPHAWQIDLRIQRARRLLEQGMGLAETALHLGFADQSHFQRAFKLRVAATPGEYLLLRHPPGAQFSSRR